MSHFTTGRPIELSGYELVDGVVYRLRPRTNALAILLFAIVITMPFAAAAAVLMW